MLNELRKHPYCIILIPRDTLHRDIHEWVTDIPVPSQVNAARALMQLSIMEEQQVISYDDDFGFRLTVLASLFDSSEPATAEGLRKQFNILRAYNKPS